MSSASDWNAFWSSSVSASALEIVAGAAPRSNSRSSSTPARAALGHRLAGQLLAQQQRERGLDRHLVGAGRRARSDRPRCAARSPRRGCRASRRSCSRRAPRSAPARSRRSRRARSGSAGMPRRCSASSWWRSRSAKLSAKPRASRAWSRGSVRPGIGTRSDLPCSAGASAVHATSASGSCPIARAAPVSAVLKRSRGDSSAIARAC